MAKSLALERPKPDFRVEDLAPYFLWTLLAAGVCEMFLYRMLSRVGVHIPKEGVVLDVYSALVRIGSFAFNVASVVVFVAVGLLAYAAVRRWGDRNALVSSTPALIMAFAGLSFLLTFFEEDASVKFAYGAFSIGILLLLLGAVLTDREAGVWRKAVIAGAVLAYLGSQYYTLANQAYQALGITVSPPATGNLLEAAEGMVVLNSLLVFAAWSGVRKGRSWRPSIMQVIVGGALVMAFLGAYRGEDSSTASILSLWTLGLTLYLPLPVYALALGLYGATIAGCLRSHESGARWDAVALVLLPVAGLTLEMSYQHLVLMGVLLLLAGVMQTRGDQERSLAP